MKSIILFLILIPSISYSLFNYNNIRRVCFHGKCKTKITIGEVSKKYPVGSEVFFLEETDLIVFVDSDQIRFALWPYEDLYSLQVFKLDFPADYILYEKEFGSLEKLSLDEVKVCNNTFIASSTHKRYCIRKLQSPKLEPNYLSIVKSCGKQIIGSDATMECVQIAQDLKRNDVVDYIKACGETFVGDSDALVCLKAGSSKQIETHEIMACADSTQLKFHPEECIEAALRD